METHEKFLKEAIRLAKENVKTAQGGPFGAVIVKNGSIISTGVNKVTGTNDPTAHAEIVAIRDACRKLNSFQLDDCIIYASCEPCPMCLGAIYWARPNMLVFAATNTDAAQAGFDDSFIYKEIPLSPEDRSIPTYNIKLPETCDPFKEWINFENKIKY